MTIVVAIVYCIYLGIMPRKKKTTEELIKAFEKHLNVCPVNILRFDGERAIGSYEFQEFLKKKKSIKQKI